MLIFIGSVVTYLLYKWKSRSFSTVKEDKADSHKTQQSGHGAEMNTLSRHVAKAFNKPDFSFIIRHCNSSLSSGGSRSNYWRHKSVSGYLEKRVLESNANCLQFAYPPIMLQLRGWTSYINNQDYPEIHNQQPEGKCFVVATALTDHEVIPNDSQVIKVTDNFTPIAWKTGEVFGILGECSESELYVLTKAFLDNELVLGEDPLHLVELATVSVEGHATNLLRSASQISSLHCEEEEVTDVSALQQRFPDERTNFGKKQRDATVSANENNFSYSSSSDNSSEDLEGKSCNEETNDESMPQTMEAAHDEDVIEGGGESLFILGDDTSDAAISNLGDMNVNFEDETPPTMSSNDSSNKSSPYKTPCEQLNVTGAGEALSPTVEDQNFLTPFRQCSTNSGPTTKHKPPNILIYCGKKDSNRQFLQLKDIFSLCVNMNQYVIYHLKHEDVNKVPWMENAAALIVSCDRLYDNIEMEFLTYFQSGGSVLAFSSTFDALFVEKEKEHDNYSGVLNLSYGSISAPVTTICGKYTFSADLWSKLNWVDLRPVGFNADGKNVIVEAVYEPTGSIAVLSQCNLDKDPSEMAISPDIYSMLKDANPRRFEVLRELCGSLGLDNTPGSPPELTPCFMYCTSQKNQDLFYESLQKRLKSGVLTSGNMKIKFITDATAARKDKSALLVKDDIVPVLLHSSVDSGSSTRFDMQKYKKHLKSRCFGNTVIYGDVVTSTMPFIDALTFTVPDGVGLIAIARSQTLGKGRGGNIWISPPGCAMFSLHMKVDLKSNLGQRISFVQHITSLAVVKAVTSISGLKDFPLTLKWPNDIYYDGKIKMGGVIVKSSILGTVIHINIGCGVNLNNKNPTTCLNELIELHNKTHDNYVAGLCSEQFIAATVSHLESIVNQFQLGGVESFLEQYYQSWQHSNKSVTIQGQESDAKIVGLDEHGYLHVQLANGTQTSVHPDGNSFDITKNLIVPRFK